MYQNIRDAWSVINGKLLGLSYFVSTRGTLEVFRKPISTQVSLRPTFPTWDGLYDIVYKLHDKGMKESDFAALVRGGSVSPGPSSSK